MGRFDCKYVNQFIDQSNIKIFTERKTYYKEYDDQLKELMDEYQNEGNKLKQRAHANQAWVFKTIHSKHFGGVMIEGAAKRAMVGGALMIPINSLVGMEYLGKTLMHAIIPQMAPLVIGAVLFHTFSMFHHQLDTKRTVGFGIPDRSLEKATNRFAEENAKWIDYDDIYDDDVDADDEYFDQFEFNEDGSVVFYDLFTGQRKMNDFEIENNGYLFESVALIMIVIGCLCVCCCCLTIISFICGYFIYIETEKRIKDNEENINFGARNNLKINIRRRFE